MPELSPHPLPRRRPPPGVRAIAEAFEERLDAMVEATLQTILLEVPVYGQRDRGVADDTRRAAGYVYASFIETLRSGHPPNEAVARSLGTVGADRAAQGIPLGDLLQAFRIAARTAAATLHAVVLERDLDRDAALWVTEALVSWIDTVSNLAAHDYSRAQARLLHEDEEARRTFLLDVLYGGISGEQALERAEEVGWDPATLYWVAVAGRPDSKDAGTKARDAFAQCLELGFVTSAHGDAVLLVPSPTPGDATRLERVALGLVAELGLHIGLSEPRSGVAGVRRSYLEAAEALEIARSAGETMVRYDDAVLDRILRRDADLLAELVDRTITPLATYDHTRNTDLVTTLETYFAEGESPTRAAEVLHTHPQTIRYRLNRIASITSLRLETAEGRLHLMLGLRARRLLPRDRRAQPHASDV